MILEKVTNGHEVIVYQETDEDLVKFLSEVKGVTRVDEYTRAELFDPTCRNYALPEYQTWYISRMLGEGWSLIGYTSGYVFSKPRVV